MPPISVIQILRKENLGYKDIISQNSKFLGNIKVEYIVYDNLKNTEVLSFIKNFGNLKYFRQDFQNAKKSFLESSIFASGQKIIFLKSDDILTINNVQTLEEIRPNISKKDLQKISNLKKENFHYDDFNLLIKDEKTFLEKIKLFFI